MRIRLAAIAAVLLAVGLGACSSTSATPSGSGSTTGATIPLLRIGMPWTDSSLDETKDLLDIYIDSLGLDTLLKLGPQGQIEPNIATSWAQTGPVTYVYHIRTGVKFWDGNPLTAADVAWSLDYEGAPTSTLAYAFPGLKSATATGPYTVTVTLDHPEANWKFYPAGVNAYVYERQFALSHKATFGSPGTLAVGSGPWKFDSLDPTKGAELSANPNWWGGKVPIQHISITFFSTEASLALAMRSGEIDLDPYVSTPKSFGATSGAAMLSTETCDIGFFGMNTTQPGWSDVHVRRAVAYALNRTDIIAANGGYAAPMSTFIPPSLLLAVASQSQINALLTSLPLYPYNLAKARQEMAQSSYPHGFSATLLSEPETADASQVVAAELAKIGIRLQIKQVTDNTWQAAETGPLNGRETAFSGSGCIQPDPSVENTWLGSKPLQQGGWNFAEYAPPSLNTLLQQSVSTSNSAQRFTVYTKNFQQLQDDVPYVGLYASEETAALSKKFAWPSYNAWSSSTDYPLGVKLAA